MDGMVGLGFFPLLSEFYENLDNRFRTKRTVEKGGAHHSEIELVELIVNMEIMIMAPLCIVVFVGILSRASWRQEAEMVLCTIQLLGTVYFCGVELKTGCLNLVPIGKPGCFAGTSTYELFFFWFATGMNVRLSFELII